MNNPKTIFVLVVLYSLFYNVQGAVIPVGSTELYTNIEDAFNAANDSDILQLAPEIFSGMGNLQVDLSNKSITIIGNSSESTIIDCENSGRAFFSFSNDSFELAFQDLTIQNCNANGTYANTSSTSANLTSIIGWGGAFALISNSTASFKNVNFITNYATQGASLYIASNHSLSIDNCYFFGNNATRGGALYLLEIPSVSLVDTQFTNNRANQSGGAIWASATTFSFTNTHFTGNTAPTGSGGGLALLDNSQVMLQSCNFRNNTANNDGGAVYSNSGADLEAYDCLFDYNVAGEGGAVSLTNFGTIRSYDSVFTNNHAQAWGGAVYIQQAEGYFYNSSVQYNSAEQGGGAGAVWNEGEVALVDSNCTENNSQRGGAFFLQYSSILQVANSYIQYNSADENGGGVYCSDSEMYLNESTTLDSNESPSQDSTEIYCAEDIPYTYCKVHGVTNFTDYCHMPDEGDAGTKEYDKFIIIGAVLIGGGFLVGCGSFVIYFLDPKHRKQQGFYWSAFKEDNEDDDAVPLPE